MAEISNVIPVFELPDPLVFGDVEAQGCEAPGEGIILIGGNGQSPNEMF